MCLRKITRTERASRAKDLIAYKVFLKLSTRGYLHGEFFTSSGLDGYRVRRWYEANVKRTVTKFLGYRPGFHAFLKEVDAIRWLSRGLSAGLEVRKVKLSGVRTYGTQVACDHELEVVVADRMYILSRGK